VKLKVRKTTLQKMKKTWKIKKSVPKEFLKKFKEIDPILLQLFFNRGLKTKKDINDFISINYEKDVFDPYLLSGVKEGVERIKIAAENKEKVCVYGDYDADGICGSTILNQTLLKIGIVPEVYIPDRKKGYGLNAEAIAELSKKGISLIVTTDCGISDIKEVEIAKKLNIDVIITDHHLFPPKPPKAHVIINPRKKGEKYPNKELSGAGVAFKLASGLIKAYPKIFKPGEEKWLLDLVAIATVADMMNLYGENRTLVKYGLLVLAKTKRLGLKTLLDSAGVKDIRVKWIDRKNSRFVLENIDAYTIGFIIGPRLNAAGRMDHANIAFYLLNSNSKSEAEKFSKQLTQKNQTRQRLQLKIITEIEKGITKEEIEKDKVIIRGDETYPRGIVGLISGRLTDRHYRPSFVYQIEDGHARGSCRSIPEMNIVEILKACSSHLKEYGGHKGAAGFSFETKKSTHLKTCLIRETKKALKGKKLIPVIGVDLALKFSQVTLGLKKTFEELEPFGQGNPEPVFLIENARVITVKKIGSKKNHLLITLKKTENGKDFYLRALLFENATETKGIKVDELYDFVFAPLFDEWQGEKRVTLKVIEWKLANG